MVYEHPKLKENTYKISLVSLNIFLFAKYNNVCNRVKQFIMTVKVVVVSSWWYDAFMQVLSTYEQNTNTHIKQYLRTKVQT
jgi:hypothetical protein